MTVEELLDQIDDMIDKAWSFPLSGGRCVVDANHLRDIIDDIRGNIPSEVRQARAIVSDRADIIATAKREAEGIVRNAEDRARQGQHRDEQILGAMVRELNHFKQVVDHPGHQMPGPMLIIETER